MIKLRGWRLFAVSALFFACLSLDFLIKKWALYSLTPMTGSQLSFPYGGLGVLKLPGFEFSLNLVFNRGMAYGLMASKSELILAMRIGLILLLSWHCLFRCTKIWQHLSMAFILAGALGNVIDVMLYRHVIDMFYLKFWGYAPFAIFNFADFSICLGIALMIISSLFDKKNDSYSLNSGP